MELMWIKLTEHHTGEGTTKPIWIRVPMISHWREHSEGSLLYLIGDQVQTGLFVRETEQEIADLIYQAAAEMTDEQFISPGRLPVTDSEKERSVQKTKLSWAQRVERLEDYMRALTANDKKEGLRVIRFPRR
jgi:hypothetical protein